MYLGDCPCPRHSTSLIIGVSALRRCALVDGMADLVPKAMMMEIADQYDKVALRAEQRLRNEKPAA
jgi:hypothetical protein